MTKLEENKKFNLRLIQNGDKDELKVLYAVVYKAVNNYFSKHGVSKYDMEDIIQDAIYMIYKNSSNLIERNEKEEIPHKKLVSYALRYARNNFFHKQTKEKRGDSISIFSEDINPDDFIEDNTISLNKSIRSNELLKNIYDKLSEESKKILILYYEGNTHQELASKFGYSDSTIRAMLFNIRNQIYHLIKDETELK